MSLRVGIIGCGGIAGVHVRGYRASQDAEVVACADISPERARDFAGKHSIPEAYADYKAMLEQERLDGVSVCTPNYAHCEPTLTALKSGVGVLCEKPIALNSDEAGIMVETARSTGVPLTIGHHMRFLPFAQFLRKMINEGELGRIYYGRSHALRRRGVPGWGEFHMKHKSGGGPLIDLGVHTLDLIIWLMGSPSPKSVSGSVYTEFGNRPGYYNPHGSYRREDFDVEDFACALIKFRDGITLSLEASWAAHIQEEETLPQMILGDRGGARLIPFAPPGTGSPLQIFTSREEALLDVTPQAFPAVEAHVEELKHWVKVLRGEKEVLVRPEESLNVQRIIDAIYRSSLEGREVMIESGGDPGAEAHQALTSLELSPAGAPA